LGTYLPSYSDRQALRKPRIGIGQNPRVFLKRKDTAWFKSITLRKPGEKESINLILPSPIEGGNEREGEKPRMVQYPES